MGDTYNEPGYTAVDICDGDVTDKVSVSGNVDTANAGKYTVTYNDLIIVVMNLKCKEL